MAREFAFARRSGASATAGNAAKWKILIVDDEPDVHRATVFALGSVVFEGRRLEFVSAHSGGAGFEALKSAPDTAVAFIDVVMEQEDAGLVLVRRIREELGNSLLRIILRTGQPGHAPEQDVIVSYDINDYKAKTDITARQLFASTVSALRSYRQLQAMEAGKIGMKKVVEVSDSLFELQSMHDFRRSLPGHIAGVLEMACDALVCVSDRSGDIRVLAAGGRFATAGDADPGEMAALSAFGLDPGTAGAIEKAFSTRGDVVRDGARAIHVSGREYGMVTYVSTGQAEFSDLAVLLLGLFCRKMSAAFENKFLYADLERRVEERTGELQRANAEVSRVQAQIYADLAIAQNMQSRLLPTPGRLESLHAETGVRIRAFNEQSSQLGGDIWGAGRNGEGNLWFYICDFSGHGIAASLHTFSLHGSVEKMANEGVEPATVLGRINRELAGMLPLGHYGTFIFGVLDPVKAEFVYASAAAPPPILLDAGGVARVIESSGVPLGLSTSATYETRRASVPAGSRLLFYSDALIEVPVSGAPWDVEGLAERYAMMAARFGEARFDALIGAFMESAERPLPDDLTAVELSFQPAG